MIGDRQVLVYEPVLVRDAVFYLERVLNADAEIKARVGDRVEPETELAVAMVAEGRPLLINVARELDIEPDAAVHYVTKPIGSMFEEGEPIARARRGLRSVTCTAPMSATLTTFDESTGVATLVPQSHPQRLVSTVYGEVESIIGERGVSLRVGGSRVQGVLALGGDTYGNLIVAVDRPDRELTADMVTSDFRNRIVLGGMTLGMSALRRLVDVGARGVITGSISDGEIRRYLAGGETEPSSMMIWRRRVGEFSAQPGSAEQGMTLFVTEGFGRRRMARPIFQFLSEQESKPVSLIVPSDSDVLCARPTMYITRERPGGDEAIQRVPVRDGTLARLIDPEHLGMVVTCRSGVLDTPGKTGVGRAVVDVEFSNGSRQLIPAASIEVLEG